MIDNVWMLVLPLAGAYLAVIVILGGFLATSQPQANTPGWLFIVAIMAGMNALLLPLVSGAVLVRWMIQRWLLP